MELQLSEKYEPLFQLLEGEHPEVDTVVITGGRFSQKSFAVGAWACVSAKDYNHRILYTRYTLTSTEDSIIPEFTEKIDMLNASDSFEVTRDRIRGVGNDSKIVFKGIKTSQGNQTAALKSLKNFSIFVVEEAEELPNFDDWDRVKKSIRAHDVRNLSILLLNPTTKTHWIYEEMYEANGIHEGFNGVNGNILYIHTTYEDMPREFIPDTIYNDFEDKRKAFEEWDKLSSEDKKLRTPLRKKAIYFKHVIKGGWLEKSEGVIFDNWTIGEYVDTGYTVYGADFGFSIDPSTLIKVSIDSKNNKIYLKGLLYKAGLTTPELAEIMKFNCGNTGKIIADCAEPRLIEELKRYGLNVSEAIKGPDSIKTGIRKMLEYELIVDHSSVELIAEFNNYAWNDKKSETPIDAYNHYIDSIRYALTDLIKPKREISFW